MVKGKRGIYVEAYKFAVYISIPIIASVYYSEPETQRYWADYWQFIKYPENPNTNMKEKIQAMIDERKKQEEQHKVYQQQMRDLQSAANRTTDYLEHGVDVTNEPSATTSWWKRTGRWITGTTKEEQ